MALASQVRLSSEIQNELFASTLEMTFLLRTAAFAFNCN